MPPTLHPPESSDPRVSRRTLLLGGAAALATPALLAACGDPRLDNKPSAGGATGGATAAAPAGGGGSGTITVLSILPMTSLTYTPEYVAVAAGLYQKQGLTVKFETTAGSAPAMQAVLADKGFITRIGDIETQNAIVERGAPFVAVGEAAYKAPMRLVSGPGKPIRTAADIRGKTIGLPSAGGTSEVTLDLVARKGGLEKKKDYTTQVVGGFSPASYELVKSGRVDGLIVSLDLSVILLGQNPDLVTLNPGDFLKSGAQFYVTTTSQAQANPDAVRKFLAATKEAMQLVAADAPEFTKTIDLIKKSGYQVTAVDDPAQVKAAMPLYVQNWLGGRPPEQMLTIDASGWTASYQEASEAGLMKGGANISGNVSDAYLPR